MKFRRDYGTVAFALAGSLLFLANTTAAIAEDFPDLEKLRIFHVGGTLEFSDCNDSTNCASGRFTPGTIRVNSAYVEEATPADQTFSIPIVFFHGGGHSGTIFRTKPDGDEGWFTSFLRRGFKVLVVDGSNRGRGGWDPVKRIAATAGLIDGTDIEDTNMYSRESACVAFRQGKVNPGNVSKCNFFGNTQFPKADHDHYLAYLNPAYRDAEANALLAANIEALSAVIGPFICLGWSTGGINCAEAMQNDASVLANVKAFISVEGGDTSTRGCINADFDPPGCEVQVATKPYLNILGDRNTGVQTSIDFVAKLDELEPTVHHETIFLPDIGIDGNGHTMMAEKNSEEIADVIEQFIRDHVPE